VGTASQNERCGRCSRPGGVVSPLRKISLIPFLGLFLILAAVLPLAAREKDATDWGAGLIVNVPFPESEVSQVVEEVVQNGIIRGSKEYNKDEYIAGAIPVSSTRLFRAWTEGGKVFYKIRLKALDPRNFKDSGDVGSLAVRYVVQPQGDKNTVLHIDAIFAEDFRHTVHKSNGSVETAEYKEIHDRLESIEALKNETVEAEKEKQEQLAKKQQPVLLESSTPSISASTSAPAPSSSASGTDAGPAETLEQHVKTLRQQVERLVKAPGAALKSAPFHTASTLQSLPAGTEVLIVISTPYWVGVETHEGQHGWILRSDLELLP